MFCFDELGLTLGALLVTMLLGHNPKGLSGEDGDDHHHYARHAKANLRVDVSVNHDIRDERSQDRPEPPEYRGEGGADSSVLRREHLGGIEEDNAIHDHTIYL